MEDITENSREEDDKAEEFLRRIDNSTKSKSRFETILNHIYGNKHNSTENNSFKEFFKQLDKDKDRSISISEVKSFLMSINRNDVNEYALKKMIKEFDYDDNGIIEEEEFMKKIKEKYEMGNTGDLEEYTDIFKLFDANNDKKIDSEDFQNVMNAIGEKMDSTQCSLIINALAQNKKDKLDFCDFFEIVKSVD